MDEGEITRIRHYLSITQTQLAQLLGVSLKAIQSFEQGWRHIPPYVERHLLFLLSLKKSSHGEDKPCWVIKNCPAECKENCPAWQFRAGDMCWFINGTICHGEAQKNWETKMVICRQCEVFHLLLQLD